jgi:1-aminocyclopropane-1-carboxylate deaminase/D-cysteine desulfhydrase-like pyridoxal-dependent ACC family enzyme
VSAYREAGLELKTDLETIRRSGGEIDFQVCVYGTGGIAAGLYAAGRLERSLPAVYAVQVYPGFWNSKFYIRSLAMLARRSHGTSQENPAGPVCVPPAAPGLYTPSGYIGDGYGTENPGCREAVDLFEMDGIFFDPVYMARAGQAVIDLARSRKPRGLLLWYTSPGRAV